jgi:hypothetical protein
MKKKKLIFSISTIFVLIVCIFIVITSGPKNDITAMEKLISKRIRTNKTVVIYSMNVIYEHRLVSYVIEDAQVYQKAGYADFIINKDGNYELINVIDADKVTKITHDIALYQFSPFKIEDYLTTTNFVMSNNPQLAKIEQIMDNEVVCTKEISNNPSITFFDDLDGTIKVKYKFYDKSGGIIQ